jgi:two-component system cell cycle response regulator
MNSRVLVVDDSEVTRAILARTLRGAGFEVLEARDGVEGAMTAFAERPAVIVTDLEMPTLDGFPLLRLLKADPASAHIPVLILTSHGEAAARFWSLRTGADAFLNKDFRPEQLISAVAGLAENANAPPPDGRAPAVGPLDVLARVARQLDSALLHATFINTLLERGMEAASFREACSAVLATVGEVVDAHFLAVAWSEPEMASIHLALEERLSEATVKEIERSLIDSLELPPATSVQTFLTGERGAAELDLRRTVWAQLVLRGGSRGSLALSPRDPWQFASSTSSLLESAIGHLSLVLENSRLSERLHELSTQDSLTRQFNHREIFERLSAELERARRYDQPLSVVLCDLDDFKLINDSHGHLAGDAVLRESAATLRRTLRTTDLFGRIGGEEFLAVLPQVDLEAARAAAERLRRSIEERAIALPDGKSVRITASFGVAAREELVGSATSDAIVTLADRRMYDAKDAGRNRVRP